MMHEALTALKGVGPGMAAKLARLGLHTVQDLLFHLPQRYEDRTRIQPIAAARLGESAQFQGEIVGSGLQYGRRRSLQCVIRDSSGMLCLRFFHFNKSQMQALTAGRQLRCYGEVRRGRSGLELYHPEYRLLPTKTETTAATTAATTSAELTPVYPLTEGVQQGRMRYLVQQALDLMRKQQGSLPDSLQDYLPPALVKKHHLHSLREALLLAHRPPATLAPALVSSTNPEADRHINPGLRRLVFEELLAHRLSMRKFKLDSDASPAPALFGDGSLSQAFLDALPFRLTDAQQQAAEEINADLSRGHPMLRLLQGDVGCGKTVVAALSCLRAIECGYQVALMAPTELLAEQHYLNFCQWLQPLGIEPGFLSGKIKGRRRDLLLQALASGQCPMLIGTHALFQDEVAYQRLGLVVIDEQHRFGVHQRLALRAKAAIHPHQLVMTATPIPRTLAMSLYADLDLTTIKQLPPGRSPVKTVLVSNDKRSEVVKRIRRACIEEGAQAYWVCTLIDESEVMQAQAAQATYQLLAEALPDLRVGLVHGRMKAAEKQTVMRQFKQADKQDKIQLLVATTVIEVGVDVPNASLMIIENPERLGLAQLHQLRGRVGRGAAQSHCLLLYQSPLSDAGKARLTVMKESNDGFYIAEKDLALRGPGQMLGTEQTGLINFRVADLTRDAGLLDEVKEATDTVLKQYPEVIDPLIRRWLGERLNYANV